VSHPTRNPFPSKENRQIPERDDLGPPVVPGGQEIGLGSRNPRSLVAHVLHLSPPPHANIFEIGTAVIKTTKAEARPTGRAVSKKRLELQGDWDGQMDVPMSEPPCARQDVPQQS
jgi:hypothetical protein